MAPESLRPQLTRAFIFSALLFLVATPAQAIRVVDWNILNYPGNTAASRNPYFRTIMQGIQADIIVTEEMSGQPSIDTFLNDVLNLNEPGQWAALPFVDGNDTDAALFYRISKFATPTQLYFYPNGATPLRMIHEYIVHPIGYSSQASEIRLYAAHLKASTGSANVAQRLAEATGWRDSLNQLPPRTHVLCLGDYNFYSGNETGFLKLLESQLDNDGRLYDPLGLQGIAWEDNATIAIRDTQSPCKVQGDPNCASGAAFGGMDDRFDLILPSLNWNDGQGYELLPNSYVAVGNDGLHLNVQLIDAPVIPEGAAFAAALQHVSDHLPVRVDIQVPAISEVAASLDLGTAIVTATASLAVSNVALAPADGLTYTLAAPAGFTAPAGTLELSAGGLASQTVSTTAGAFGLRTGDLVLASDDLDHPARTIALTANVLDHAHASLDSTSELTSASFDFGTLPAAAFTAATVTVHNFGYSAAQAKLVLSGAAITGGDGHFSITSGDAAATIAAVGQRFELAFDPSGATPDSQYTATLSFTGNDEPLPGAAAAGALTVSLSAAVSSGPLAVPIGPGAPDRSRLYTPFPNPLTAESRIHFDLSRHTDLRLDVIDLSGRRVMTLEHRTFEPGRYALAWSGRDDSGSRVAPGVYFIRMTSSSLEPQAVRLAVVR